MMHATISPTTKAVLDCRFALLHLHHTRQIAARLRSILGVGPKRRRGAVRAGTLARLASRSHAVDALWRRVDRGQRARRARRDAAVVARVVGAASGATVAGRQVLGERLCIDNGSGGGAGGLVSVPERRLCRETPNLFGVLTQLALELLNTTSELLSTGTRNTATTTSGSSNSATAERRGDTIRRDGTTRRRGRVTKRLMRTTKSSQGTKRLETTRAKENLVAGIGSTRRSAHAAMRVSAGATDIFVQTAHCSNCTQGRSDIADVGVVQIATRAMVAAGRVRIIVICVCS